MLSPRDKILIYQWRTLSQRIEAVFDFMRLCRRAWFLSVAVLFLPVCVALTSSAFIRYAQIRRRDTPLDWFDDFFGWGSGSSALIYGAVALVGVWAVFIHVYSLLAAYEDNDFCLDGTGLRKLWPYMKACFWPALVPTAVVVAVILTMVAIPNAFVIFLLLVIAVPLSLFAPVYMIERRSFFTALSKAVGMGLSSWMSLAFSMLMMVLFGAVMLLSVNVPWMLARLFIDTFSSSGEEWGYVMLLRFVSLLLTIVGYLSCYMVGAMVALLCVYHYGYMSEMQGDSAVYGKTIDDFEKM
ncbi:MAG: hypothetical protein J5637_03695 [Prevotella sp.]|nr:hypothetical protein [Prevotella sp.]